ncbi:hypothetical protein LOTGIDRAFT_228336 [Lottia gigantea]|uniref:Uncharacterized protein n=1 Tax=Lottia gigantea TaxID=225164 RepID=V4A1R0_LOTGI|nr:hypothetical protein LOTGIDRAFT_228336 [Lottia gigantea]ESO97768.1 hypothetical protein LOTGIDRAFT_228336 [Lottia gigantea]
MEVKMGDTLFHKSNQSHYPYWVNVPPTVPKYPVPNEMFRRESPEKFTYKTGPDSWQNWTDKWSDYSKIGYHKRRLEELPKRLDAREPCSRRMMYNIGTSATPTWSREGKDWPVDDNKYMRNGRPATEVKRANAIYRLSDRDEKLYPFSNYMTSTYRRPVYSVFGPLQKREVYGITHQHNRHGFMPFEDYY